MKTLTPPDLQIRPRRLDLKPPDPLPRHWLAGDPFKTHFFNSMSVLFPDGEHFFIDSVRLFRDQIQDPTLKEHIRGFIGQEGHHSREHLEYSQRLRDLGYDVDWMEARVLRRIRFVQKNFSPERQLAGTVAMEHFTAIMADAVLRNPQWMAGAIPEMQTLWRWHALEETEHKSVAFDVYMQVCGDRKLLRRAMRQSTFFFLKDVTQGMWHMLRRDGQLNAKVMIGGMRWLWGREGFFRLLLRDYRDYYNDDFHPWQHDNQDMLKLHSEQFSSALLR